MAAETGFWAEVDALRARVEEVKTKCALLKNVGADEDTTATGEGEAQELATVCKQQQWENVKFGCEIAKVIAFLRPPLATAYVCLAIVTVRLAEVALCDVMLAPT